MNWLLAGIGIVGFAGGLWFFVPTLRLLGRRDFEPAPTDPASVENAQMTRLVDGGQ